MQASQTQMKEMEGLFARVSELESEKKANEAVQVEQREVDEEEDDRIADRFASFAPAWAS